MLLPILKLTPHLTPRPWGGHRLKQLFPPLHSEASPIGEAWALSDRAEGPSQVSGGPFTGCLFGDLLSRYPPEMTGTAEPCSPYPLLVKYIDAEEDLSIQVHPDDAYAERKGLQDRGKTECWYIVDCLPSTEIIYGLKDEITHEDLKAALAQNTIGDVVRRLPIKTGDFLFVPPGTVHAILGGTFLCEIQQSSDLTFRLWDWNRMPARTLHIEESLEVISYTNFGVKVVHEPPLPGKPILLIENSFFKVTVLHLLPHGSYTIAQPGHGLILNGVGGSCYLEDTRLTLGDTFFVPACIPTVEVKGTEQPSTILMSHIVGAHGCVLSVSPV